MHILQKDLESHPALLSEICSELYNRGAPTAKRQRVKQRVDFNVNIMLEDITKVPAYF